MDSELTIIGVKQLYSSLKDISERVQGGEEFLVVKNSVPVFKIIPLQVHKTRKKKRGMFLEEFQDLQFHTDEPDLSKKIDKLLYR